MAKHPSEVFGHPIEENTKKARAHQRKYWCPFVGQGCTKQSRLIEYPMGVCSVQYRGHPRYKVRRGHPRLTPHIEHAGYCVTEENVVYSIYDVGDRFGHPSMMSNRSR